MVRRRSGILNKFSVSEACIDLPDITLFNHDKIKTFDLVITTVGFEDRSLAFVQESCSEFQCEYALVGKYKTNKVENEINEASITNFFMSHSIHTSEVCADSPLAISKKINEILDNISQEKKIIRCFFDISSASNRFILSVLQTLTSSNLELGLSIFYAEPTDYFPQSSEYHSNPEACISEALASSSKEPLIETGVSAVNENELYPGHFPEVGKPFLISIPSYRMTRMGRCIQQIDEQLLSSSNKDSCFWIFGEPKKEILKWRTMYQKSIVENYLKKFTTEDSDSYQPPLTEENSKRCCTLNYKEILAALIELADSNLGKRITIVPMGSKLQAVGVALALYARSECSVLHASPGAFNPNRYSNGIGDKWLLEFESISNVKRIVSKIGELELTPI
ncbi:hypothetical protein C2869_09680 [Saccharobesus litoralis]|uniref:Uncharacterized protein n=1 Tax=Saccharobesus litoralis TaxID=2172099 RepID=A0A2S0VR48_9ALTE|nr:hypothetical protein [Saccharobesus litoralis]AWB66683.1 hypothetical protein C2869_09680 [Saccharobesus litoralis]